jgi:hypothetical protein
MTFPPRAAITLLALAFLARPALAVEDDLDFDDDDFFDEVSKDKDAKDDRRRSDDDLGDDLGADPDDEDPFEEGFEEEGVDPDLGEDPDWDREEDPDLGDDPPEDLDGPIGDPDEPGFDEDPPEDSVRTARMSSPGDLEDPDESARSDRRPPKAAPAKPAGPARLDLSTDDMEVLGGGYDFSVVAVDLDAVVVELPVLVARSGSDFAGEDFWVVAEFLLGDTKVGEARYLVTQAGIADLGPTIVWVKQHVPVVEERGTIQVKVSRQGGEDPPQNLFSKSAPYKL